ncbi:CocE/NonD family hydrolase [bacterium]|nr:CocE/NonD family hydrolase [bacterium]
MIGPWSHDTVRGTTVGELTFPTTSADVDPSVIPQAWDGLQWAMKPLGRNPLFTTPTNHVRAYFIGSDEPAMQTTAPHNHWYELNTWPPVYSDHFLFLSSGATGLSDLAPVGDSTVGWECNPANPVLTSGGANLPVATVADAGPYDQVALEMRTDVLTFRSAALADDLPIAGPATITLFVETDAVDTDIMVKLIDEYPDGRNMLVADSGVRLSWYTNKTGLGDPAPNTVYEVTMDIGQRAYVFGTGHKVGIDIQSTNYPRFDINPGNGDPFIDGPNGVIQNNTLHMSETQISRLSLPEYDPTA